MENVYTLSEVMKILKLSMNVVTAELVSGRLKSIRIGRQYRITEGNLMAYLNGDSGMNAEQEEKKLKKIFKKPLKSECVEEQIILPMDEAVEDPVIPILNKKSLKKTKRDNSLVSDLISNSEDAEKEDPTRKIVKGNGALFQRIPEVDKLILSLKEEGHSYVRIATTLNDKGYTNTNGNVWNKNAVDRRYTKLKELGESGE